MSRCDPACWSYAAHACQTPPSALQICEKLAYGSTTRFEDLTRLPLGISVNFTSFSAKMLAFLAYYPKSYLLYSALGELVEMTVRRLSTLAAAAGGRADRALIKSCWDLLHVARRAADT